MRTACEIVLSRSSMKISNGFDEKGYLVFVAIDQKTSISNSDRIIRQKSVVVVILFVAVIDR